jgi:hypothetical protein
MLNMKDVYVAQERYADMRRTAEKQNAIARMKAYARGAARAGKRFGIFGRKRG